MVDLTFLKQFTKGDTAKMKRYITIYLQMTPQTLRDMQGHLKNKNWTQLGISAHSLKPQADFMGVATLKNILMQIEQGVKSGQVAKMAPLYQKAVQIYRQSEQVLQRHLRDL